MGEGDIHVSQDGNDWVVVVEGIKGTIVRYETRAAAVEAGRRIATAARSTLRINSPITKASVDPDRLARADDVHQPAPS